MRFKFECSHPLLLTLSEGFDKPKKEKGFKRALKALVDVTSRWRN